MRGLCEVRSFSWGAVGLRWAIRQGPRRRLEFCIPGKVAIQAPSGDSGSADPGGAQESAF